MAEESLALKNKKIKNIKCVTATGRVEYEIQSIFPSLGPIAPLHRFFFPPIDVTNGNENKFGTSPGNKKNKKEFKRLCAPQSSRNER